MSQDLAERADLADARCGAGDRANGGNLSHASLWGSSWYLGRGIASSGVLTHKFTSHHTSSLAEGHALAYDRPL